MLVTEEERDLIEKVRIVPFGRVIAFKEENQLIRSEVRQTTKYPLLNKSS